MAANFRELIRKAIAIEAKMAEFYGTMATKATTPEAREIFKILAGEEEEHRALLQTYKEQGVFPRVSQVEEADLEPTLKVVASITPDTTPTDALAFAIRSEEYQHKFYKKLSQEYPPGLTQNFLKRMADMELVHKERVEKLHRWFSRFHGESIKDT
jgi:rubrerythrin